MLEMLLWSQTDPMSLTKPYLLIHQLKEACKQMATQVSACFNTFLLEALMQQIPTNHNTLDKTGKGEDCLTEV